MIEKGGDLINEGEMGIDEMVDDLEECYLKSCSHNEKSPDDLNYMRRYIWVTLAMMVKRQTEIEKRMFYAEKSLRKIRMRKTQEE